MEDAFKIFIEQLRDGREKKISEILSPDFLDIREESLLFRDPVQLSGVAYLAENELVLNLTLSTQAFIACSMCNELTPLTIHIENCYHSESLKEISGGIYSLKDFVRETILLGVPPFIECHEGHCPQRRELAKYLLRPSTEFSNEADGYHPFANLEWKE